jgi:hypothetical protein
VRTLLWRQLAEVYLRRGLLLFPFLYTLCSILFVAWLTLSFGGWLAFVDVVIFI